jgi:hypothetical protein
LFLIARFSAAEMTCQDECGIDNEAQRMLYAAKASLLEKHFCSTFAYLKTITGMLNRNNATRDCSKDQITQ